MLVTITGCQSTGTVFDGVLNQMQWLKGWLLQNGHFSHPDDDSEAAGAATREILRLVSIQQRFDWTTIALATDPEPLSISMQIANSLLWGMLKTMNQHEVLLIRKQQRFSKLSELSTVIA